MVPDVRIIFEKWFDTYAKPREEFKDAETLTEAKYMDKKSCVQFMTSTIKGVQQTGIDRVDTVITESSNAIKALYDEYDSDHDGRLTKADFFNFYHQKCIKMPHVVWQNLEKHNVGKDLLPGQALEIDLTYSNDSCLIQSQEELPRYFISANQEQFNFLFNLEN